MKVFGIILGIFVLVAALVGGSLVLGYMDFSNQAAGFEVDIKAQYNNNRNVYDNGFKKVTEIAQVPQLEIAGLKQLYDGAMKGRYGSDGSKAMAQFIKEQNPTLDQPSFRKIQQTMEIFRNDFQGNQTRLISEKQAYERFLTATTSGRIYNTVGHYPRIDLSVYDIMTSDQTEHDFATKRGAAINITGNK
jgi:hypothetical protein